jgi:hypothetical protein
LLIDALDVTRVQGSGGAYRQLVREVTSREGRWRVVCSIRKFDLRYSAELQELFAAQQPLQVPEGFQDPEFAGLQHLNIAAFSPAELAQLESQAPALWQLLQVAEAPLQRLLVVPFNLRLAAELLQLGSTIGGAVCRATPPGQPSGSRCSTGGYRPAAQTKALRQNLEHHWL